MNLRELAEQINYSWSYGYPGAVTLANNTSEASFEVSLGNMAFSITSIETTIMDSAGKIIDENNTNDANAFTIQITDESGNNWFNNPVSLLNFKKITTSPNWKGRVFPAQKKYTVTIKALAFPTVSAATFPIRVDVLFNGFNRNQVGNTTTSPNERVLI